jgi:hypothetical protein
MKVIEEPKIAATSTHGTFTPSRFPIALNVSCRTPFDSLRSLRIN